MPIVIKEVLVKTTVERTVPQGYQLPRIQIEEQIKRLVAEKLSDVEHTSRTKRYKKDR